MLPILLASSIVISGSTEARPASVKMIATPEYTKFTKDKHEFLVFTCGPCLQIVHDPDCKFCASN